MWLHSDDTEQTLPAAIVDLDFRSATLPEGFALSRSAASLARSTATGRWTSIAADTVRQSVDLASLEITGTLIEPSRSQIVYNSRTPNYTPVQCANATDPAAQTPFGLGALKLTPNTTSTLHGFDFEFSGVRAPTLGDNATVAITLIVKPVGAYSFAVLSLLGRDGLYRTVFVQLQGQGAVLSHTVTSAAVEPETDGYYAVKIVCNYGTIVAGSTGKTAVNLAVAAADGNRTFAGDGTSHFLIAYLGAELGNSVTSPILSAGTITVRPDETLIGKINWVGADRFSFAAQYTPHTTGDFTALHAKADNGSSMDVRQNSAGITSYFAAAQGANVAAISGPSLPANVERTALITSAADDFRFYVNGTQVGSDAAGSAPTSLTTIAFGSTVDGAGRGPMTLRRLKYWPAALTPDEAKAFSTDISLSGALPALTAITLQSARTVMPNETSVIMTLALEGSLTGSQVSYKTVDGTAVAGQDYAGVSGTLYLSPGQTSATVTLTLGTRSITEARTFTFELFNPVSATLAVTICTITLQSVLPQGSPATSNYDFSTGSSSSWVLTRSTAAWGRNSSGVWQSTPVNVERIHYLTPTVSGLLIEGAGSEQRLFDSVDPTLTVTASTKTTVTSEQTATGTRQVQWRKNSTAATDHLLGCTFTSSNSDMPTGEFTLSMLVRPVNWSLWKLRVKGIDNVWREAVYNLLGAGTIVSSELGVTATIERDAHFTAWYRVGLYRTQTVTAGVSAEFQIIPINDDLTVSQTGDTTQGLDLCHLQLEPTTVPTSPIIVQAGSAKTVRAADVYKADATEDWYKFPSYSIGLSVIQLSPLPATQRLISLRDTSSGTTSDDIGIALVSGAATAKVKVRGAVLPDLVSPSVIAAGTISTVLLTVDASKEVALYRNGVKIGADAITSTPVAPAVLRVGSTEPAAADPMTLLLRRVSHWDHAISQDDAELFSADLNYTPPPEVAKPIVSIPATLSVTEGGTVTVTVTKDGVDAACQILLSVDPQTAGRSIDYTHVAPVTVSFAIGETSKTVTVTTLEDLLIDPDETFAVILVEDDTSCTLGNAACIVRITDNDSPTIGGGVYAAPVGFATTVDAGIGNPPYYVISLDWTLTDGTLRHALTQSDRHVIFEVAGRCQIPPEGVTVSGRNLTISGETAPAPGIILQGGALKFGAASNIHIRHVTIERGHDARVLATSDADALDLLNTSETNFCENIWFDHCAFLWAAGWLAKVTPTSTAQRGLLRNISFTNCIFAEPLDDPHAVVNASGTPYRQYHEGGFPLPAHGRGLAIGNETGALDVQYCLFTDCRRSAPSIASDTASVLANNITLNCGQGVVMTLGTDETAPKPFLNTTAGHLVITGPDSTQHGGWMVRSSAAQTCPAGSKAWVKGIYAWTGLGAASAPFTETELLVGGKAFLYAGQSNCLVSNAGARPIDIPGSPVPLLTADEIYKRGKDNVGPRPKERAACAVSVQRVITKLVNKTGRFVDHPSQVGDLSVLPPAARSLRSQNAGTPPKFKDGITVIPEYPTDFAINKGEVRNWLKKFSDELQFDLIYG